MATIKQIDANRRNAQKSTGPATAEGKVRSSSNALKSGVYAESELIPGEDPAALAQLTSEYFDHHQPATPEARDLVDSLIRNAWLLRRLAAAEAHVFNCDCPSCHKRFEGQPVSTIISTRYGHEIKTLDFIQRRMNAAERNFHRSLKALHELESLQPPPAEPVAEPATSGKLASFPQSRGDAHAASQPEPPDTGAETAALELNPPCATEPPQIPLARTESHHIQVIPATASAAEPPQPAAEENAAIELN